MVFQLEISPTRPLPPLDHPPLRAVRNERIIRDVAPFGLTRIAFLTDGPPARALPLNRPSVFDGPPAPPFPLNRPKPFEPGADFGRETMFTRAEGFAPRPRGGLK